MKNYYENEIAKSKLKQQLMEEGLRKQMQNPNLSLNYINECIGVIKAEEYYRALCDKSLQEIISGEAEKKRKAKELLGIGG